MSDQLFCLPQASTNVQMKPSGVDWIGEVPADWNTMRIKNLAAVNPPTRMPDDSDVDFFPMLSIGVDGGMLMLEKKNPALANGYSSIRSGDVIYAKVTPCFENGKSSIVPVLKIGVGLATTEITCLRPNSSVHSGFLHYRIKAYDFKDMGINEMKGAGGLKRVPDRCAADFVIALPPLPEQIAIAAYLDKTTALIDKQRALLERKKALLQEHKKALIHEAVTKGLQAGVPMKASGVDWIGEVPANWKIGRLADVACISNGYPFSSEEFNETGIPIIKMTNINGDGPFMCFNGQALSCSKRYQVENDDILLGLSGSIGATVWSSGAALLNQRLARVRSKRGWIQKYCFYSTQVAIAASSEELASTTIKNLSMKQVESLPLPLPHLDQQIAIATHLDKTTALIDKQFQLLERKIDLSGKLRASIIHEAVTKGVPV